MRGAYSRKSDTLTLDKATLTQRSIMNEMFKFYREHLHPLTATGIYPKLPTHTDVGSAK